MSESMWANVLTAIPATAFAAAALLTAWKGLRKTALLEHRVNGLLEHRDRAMHAEGVTEGELVGQRRAEDVETERRLREQLQRGSE